MGASVSAVSRSFAGLVALVSIAALCLQYLLLLRQAQALGGAGMATLKFFSYFTILSNVGVALVAGAGALGRGGLLSQPRWRGLVALCISVTGLIYAAVLRGLWQPQGWQWWADIGLHDAAPLLYLAWWGFGGRHGGLGWRDLGAWLCFPLGYLAWVLLRGQWVGDYPYPFLDLTRHGVTQVARNAAWVTLVFVALGAGLLGLDRLLSRRAR
jgi:hypothetical protein